MTYVIIHALAPIFVIMLLGFWAGKAGMVDNKNVSDNHFGNRYQILLKY